MSLKPLVAVSLGGAMLVALTSVAPQAGALGDLLPVAGASTSQGPATASYLHDVS
jgi:hypothetical protein